MCLVKFSLIILYFLIFDANALTCRSDGGPKESELKSIYSKCLKMQDGKNSSRDYGDQDWKENRRNQRNEWDGQMESDKGRNNKGNRNDRRGMDDRMGNYDDSDRMNSQNDRMGGQTDRMGRNNNRMGSQSDRMGNRDDRMGGYDDRSDNYDRLGSRDSRMSGDSRSQDPNVNRYGRDENMNGRNDYQHDFGSEFSQQFGYQSTQSPHRYKRKSENSGNRSQFNPNSKRYQESTRSDDDNSSERNTSKDNDKNDKKNCALHCFLENLEMTAEDGMPDRYLVTHALTKDVNNEDLKDFLQESIEECFQILDNENTENKCEFSKNLLMCLSEKGRENCDDWKDDLRF